MLSLVHLLGDVYSLVNIKVCNEILARLRYNLDVSYIMAMNTHKKITLTPFFVCRLQTIKEIQDIVKKDLLANTEKLSKNKEKS